MGLHIIVSNSAGPLAAHFREKIYKKRTAEDLFVKETVVVQSQGMSVWLNQQLADPIAANLETPFLNTFADSVLQAYWPEDEKPLMTEDWMFWRIFRLLLSELQPNYPELAQYVQGEKRSMKACQLAKKIAALYDTYQMYHPDLLQQWRKSKKDNCWQARLYRVLSDEAVSRDIRFNEFRPERGKQPDRISVFGINSLAPNYFEFFRKLGEVSEVWMYYLNPSLEYWGENESRKKAATRLLNGDDPDEGLIGNQLLTSLGRQGRDFFLYLFSRDDVRFEEQLLFQHPVPNGNSYPCYLYPEAKLLSTIQEDILLNIFRSKSADKNKPASGLPLDPGGKKPDDSIIINSCHNELRQTEVLYDQLLKLLEDQDLAPRDILVMAPDISVFEPYIQTVFGSEKSKLRNHFTIADRSLRKQNICADALLKVMQLLNGKFKVNEVLSLFENPELAERWNFSRQNLEDIRNWLNSLKVCWGINAEHRKKVSGTEFGEFSWEPALDRLILGCAVAEEPASDKIIPVYPIDAAEGLNSKTAGDLAAFMHQLFDFQKRMTANHSLSEWSDLIEELMDMLFCSGSRNYRELTAIRETLKILKNQGESELWKDWNGMDLQLAGHLLETNLLPTAKKEPFLRGKITFCSLMPMRSIPMKVIAVLGLDELSFPRKDQDSGFNIKTAAEQRAALVRSRGTEDRYIFLETLLAAQEHLLLFYQGKNKLTGKEILPSLPVKELIDELNAAFPVWRNQFIRKQCLRSYDPCYFQGNPEYYSYSEQNYAAAQIRCGAMPEVKKLLDELKAEVPETITPELLIEFFMDPCGYYLKNVLKVDWKKDYEIILKDAESIEPGSGELSQLNRELVRMIREQPDLMKDNNKRARLADRLRKNNMTAPGHQGEVELKEALRLVQTIPDEYLAETVERTVSLKFGETAIEGPIAVNMADNRLYVLSETTVKTRKLLEFYLKHLILCASSEDTEKSCFCSYSKDGTKTVNKKKVKTPAEFSVQYLAPVSPDEAMARLEKLMEYFRKGHSRPLAFFLNAGAHQVGRTNKDNHFGSTAKEDFKKEDLKRNPAVKIFFEPESTTQEDVYNEFTELSNLLFGFTKRKGELKNG